MLKICKFREFWSKYSSIFPNNALFLIKISRKPLTLILDSKLPRKIQLCDAQKNKINKNKIYLTLHSSINDCNWSSLMFSTKNGLMLSVESSKTIVSVSGWISTSSDSIRTRSHTLVYKEPIRPFLPPPADLLRLDFWVEDSLINYYLYLG